MAMEMAMGRDLCDGAAVLAAVCACAVAPMHDGAVLPVYDGAVAPLHGGAAATAAHRSVSRCRMGCLGRSATHPHSAGGSTHHPRPPGCASPLLCTGLY